MHEHREKAMWGQVTRWPSASQGKETSGETNPAGSLIFHFSLQTVRNFLLFNPQSVVFCYGKACRHSSHLLSCQEACHVIFPCLFSSLPIVQRVGFPTVFSMSILVCVGYFWSFYSLQSSFSIFHTELSFIFWISFSAMSNLHSTCLALSLFICIIFIWFLEIFLGI